MIAGIVGRHMVFHSNPPLWNPVVLWTGVEILFFAGGWTAYFQLSSRVANTYYYLDDDNGLQAAFA